MPAASAAAAWSSATPQSREAEADAEYYERDRVELFSQGDLFRDVPLAYPLPADELVVDEDEQGGSRRFLSGPLEFGPAMLITPSCSLAPRAPHATAIR